MDGVVKNLKEARMRQPDMIAPWCRIWKIRPKVIRKKSWEATLTSWIIEGPYHRALNNWVLGVIDLKNIPGVQPATLHYPEARFEIAITAVDPVIPINVDEIEAGTGVFHILRSPDFVKQFHDVTEEEAVAIAENMITDILLGNASPESDWRSIWRVFVENELEKIRKKKGGAHEATPLSSTQG